MKTENKSTTVGATEDRAKDSYTESTDRAARRLTFKDIEPVLDRLALAVSQDEGTIGDLLTVLAAAAYSKQVNADSIYIMLRDRVMCYVSQISLAADHFVIENISAARGVMRPAEEGDDS